MPRLLLGIRPKGKALVGRSPSRGKSARRICPADGKIPRRSAWRAAHLSRRGCGTGIEPRRRLRSLPPSRYRRTRSRPQGAAVPSWIRRVLHLPRVRRRRRTYPPTGPGSRTVRRSAVSRHHQESPFPHPVSRRVSIHPPLSRTPVSPHRPAARRPAVAHLALRFSVGFDHAARRPMDLGRVDRPPICQPVVDRHPVRRLPVIRRSAIPCPAARFPLAGDFLPRLFRMLELFPLPPTRPAAALFPVLPLAGAPSSAVPVARVLPAA